ncbi:MAG TPA: hypothetical protein VFY14_14885, partial [Streptomyces sp.]|nr:hypothetical protein [Streptomyces sp.]
RERAAHTDPSRLSITINNRNGRFSPRNPESDLYGLIGRNTRCRLSVPGGEARLELDGSLDGVASTPDAAALDITGDLDVRWEGEADWYRKGAHMLIGKWSPTPGERSYHLRLQEGSLYLFASRDGTAGVTGFWELPRLPRRAALRGVLDADNGAGGWTMRLYWAESLDGPWTQIGNDLSGTTPVAVHSGPAPLVIAPYQLDVVDNPQRYPVAGRIYRAEVRAGIDGTVVAAPDFRAQAAGTTVFADSAGRTWTLSGTATIRDRHDMFVGEVSVWPQKWTVDGGDAWVPIEASGILRRMGQGRKALQSTLRRRVPSFSPLAYWPMEEGEFATRASSPIRGVPPLRLTNAKWASADSLPSSMPLPTLNGTTTDPSHMTGVFPNPSFAALSSWRVDWMYRLDQPNTTLYTYMRVLSLGRVREWYVQTRDTQTRVLGRDVNGDEVFSQLIGTGTDLFGQWIQTALIVQQNGANVDWTIAWRDVGGDAGLSSGSFAGSAGRPTGVSSPPGGYAQALNGMAIGHIAVWDTHFADGFMGAVDAWSGETAWERMRRLSIEEDLSVSLVPGPENPQRVGPQKPDTILNLLQAAANADGGLLLEDRWRSHGPGLVFRERSSMYNQDPKIVLSYDQAPGLAAPPDVVDDDTSVRNDRTVKRDGGSEARAVLEEGPLSVQDPPDGIGRYDDSITLSLHDDAQAGPFAAWLLHLGTVDGARYPRVKVMLHKAPHLIPQVLALTEGDAIRI